MNDNTEPIDIHQRKRQLNDSSLNNPSIPLATDLQSLPGHNQDETRDQRFLDYYDTNTLSMHFNSCLYIDKKKLFSSSYLTKQHIFKTRHNVLNKIFKLHYMTPYENCDRNMIFNKKDEEIKSNVSSSTSISFKNDWSVNRRSSSTHRREPKNPFHILQLHPRKEILPPSTKPTAKLSVEDQQQLDYERIKNLLVRTYYPHFHAAIEHRYYFGSKCKPPIKHHDSSIFISPESPTDMSESTAITLKSPPSTSQQEPKRGRQVKNKKLKAKPLPIASVERRVSEEIPPVMIKESILVSTPPESSSKEKKIDSNRKRKISSTINSTNTIERKKRKFVSSPSPEFINEYHDISYSER